MLPCLSLQGVESLYVDFFVETHFKFYLDIVYVFYCRSYDLMDHMLKVYIYKEGEKPVFHQPLMRGIYASEGWFMKLVEGNKKFVVRDPKKAHLFYLPFDSHMLRLTLSGQNVKNGKKVLEKYLKSYVGLIARKYSFWNRTEGADHFLVACHDWVWFSCINLILMS